MNEATVRSLRAFVAMTATVAPFSREHDKQQTPTQLHAVDKEAEPTGGYPTARRPPRPWRTCRGAPR